MAPGCEHQCALALVGLDRLSVWQTNGFGVIPAAWGRLSDVASWCCEKSQDSIKMWAGVSLTEIENDPYYDGKRSATDPRA